MVAHTARGFPSAEDSDDLADVPAIMLELATLLEARVRLMSTGSFSLAMASIDTNYDQVVTFPVGLFPAAPLILGRPCPVTTNPHLYDASITAISAAQMTVRARRTTGSSTPVTFHWAVRG
jgi:hypothetical protein